MVYFGAQIEFFTCIIFMDKHMIWGMIVLQSLFLVFLPLPSMAIVVYSTLVVTDILAQKRNDTYFVCFAIVHILSVEFILYDIMANTGVILMTFFIPIERCTHIHVHGSYCTEFLVEVLFLLLAAYLSSKLCPQLKRRWWWGGCFWVPILTFAGIYNRDGMKSWVGFGNLDRVFKVIAKFKPKSSCLDNASWTSRGPYQICIDIYGSLTILPWNLHIESWQKIKRINLR